MLQTVSRLNFAPVVQKQKLIFSMRRCQVCPSEPQRHWWATSNAVGTVHTAVDQLWERC